MSFTSAQLFTPVPSGVGLNPNVQPGAQTWLGSLLVSAQILQLPTTSWQPGGPERTLLAVDAVAFSQEDVLISKMAQGGFLDTAASGTVTYVNIDGTSSTFAVTPDPSNPAENPNGAPGWLDALGQSFYLVFRNQATYAAGQIAIANTNPSTLNYIVGTYHTANVNTGATYANTDALTIPTSAISGSGGVVVGVVSSPTTTTITTSAAHGLAPNDIVYLTGLVGIALLNNTFALVISVSSTTFVIASGSSGAWTSGGTVFKSTIANMQADVIGPASNAAPGAVTVTVTQNPGVFVSNLAAWSAATYEGNIAYAARCRLKLGALSPNGASQAYQYFALTSQQLLAAETPSVVLTNGPISKAISYSNPQTGVVQIIIASSTPAAVGLNDPVTPGCAQVLVSDATNATPILVSTATAHALSTGDTVSISGVLGNTAANQTATITRSGPAGFTLNGSVGNGAYLGGGVVEGGDLGQIDQLIQQNVVPDGQRADTISAKAFPILVVATVVVPTAYVASYTAAVGPALQALIASYPIGGNIPPGGTAGTIPLDALEGALFAAGITTLGQPSYVRDVNNLSANSQTSGDLVYPAPDYLAILVTPTIAVQGV